MCFEFDNKSKIELFVLLFNVIIDFIIVSLKFDIANIYGFFSTMQNKVLFYEIFNIIFDSTIC